MTTETKLLPCPFCGGEAELDEYCGKYVVFCKNSSCSWRETKEQAIEAWNTRYERTCRLIAIDGGYEEPVYAWACDQCGNDEIDTSYVRCWKCNAKVVGYD